MRFTIFLLLCLVSNPVVAQDWPALRGQDGLGSSRPSSNLAQGDVKLETRWKKKIGSGYSSVVVAGNRVVTMYTDGTNDLLASLSASTGETVWTLPIGPMFKGENGSFDGPLSTPCVYKGNIYAISATGKLLCVEAESGKEVWSKEFVKDFGATQPLYGFVTSPVITQDTLIVQTGIKDKSLMGLDPNSGEIRWGVSSDSINSQTPFATKFAGEDIVLACGGKKFIGVNPVTGELQFEIEHGGGNGSAMTPVPIGDDTFLLTLDDMFSKAFQLSKNDEGKIECEEVWKENSIKNTYNIPSLSGEDLFAYSTRILTCVDPETGKPHWKSRKPGDGFLITIDDHLLINTKKGELVIAKADSDEYEPVANLKLFEDIVWSIPAYSDNSIFARSLGEIARVDIVPGDDMTKKTVGKMQLGDTKFSTFIKRIGGMDESDRQAEVTKWVANQTIFPITENETVNFVYIGEDSDVALASDMFGARQEKPMDRLAGTNLHYYSMQLPRDQRANYVFLVNYKPILDPRNKRVVTSTMYAGEMEFAVRLRGVEPLKMSWFGMPDWKMPAYFSGEESKVAKTVECKIDAPEGDENPEPIEFKVCLPNGYDEKSDVRYPTAYVFNGSQALQNGKIATAIGNSDDIKCIVVLVDGFGPTFGPILTEKIVPFIDKKFSTIAHRQQRMVMGFGFAGTDSLLIVANANDTFGVASCQSPLAFADAQRAIVGSMEKVKQPTKVHLQWGRFDMFNPDENWDLRTGSKEIFDAISKNENVSLSGGMVNDSTDWSSWRNRYQEIFALLPSSQN